MSILIAIPARGESKRLPNKNILPLNGKPMIVHTIDAAKKSKLTNEIWVCTDDNEIEDIANKNKVNVYKIPKSMAGDDVSSTVPCLSLAQYLDSKNKNFKYLFNLQPTSPLRNSEDIILSFQKLKSGNFNFLVSITDIDPHYFHWAMNKKNDEWRMYFREKYLKERIYLEKVYRPNGAIKLALLDELIMTRNFFGKNLGVYMMPEERSIHIGNEFDFTCAKSFF